METIFVFLSDGFEEIEALGTVDILRRAGLNVCTISMNDDLSVKTAHEVILQADELFDNADYTKSELLILPGGSMKLNDYPTLKEVLKIHNAKGKYIAAICAAPAVLGCAGLLHGRRVTCYPGFEGYCEGAEITGELCTVDGNIITGKGPAATLPFAYTLTEMFAGKHIADQLREGMIYNQLVR